MDIRLRIIILIGSLITLTTIINMIKKEKLELKYALSWIIINGGVLIVCIFPQLIEWIALIIGVALPMNAIFFIGMICSLLIVFSLTIAQSRNSQKLKDVTQKLALLEHELEKIKK